MTYNPAARALSDLVATATGDMSRDHRIIVPCPSSALAMELHASLMDKGKASFLVLAPGSAPQPDAERRYLLPEAVTSVRDGTFILVLMPGTLSLLPDSVAGIGGTIRSLAFTDEWPWTSEDSEHFRFDGPFLSSWSHELGLEAGSEWEEVAFEIARMVRDILTPWQEGRAIFLFDEFLAVEPTPTLTEGQKIQALLMALGVPSGAGFETVGAVRDHMRACKEEVGKALVDRIRALGSRESASSRVGSVAETLEVDPAQLQGALDQFLDRLGSAPPQPEGLLSLSLGLRVSGGWGPESWELMSLRALQLLFLDESEAPSVQLTLSAAWLEPTGQPFFISASGRTLCCNSDAAPSITFQVDGLTTPVDIEVLVGRKVVVTTVASSIDPVREVQLPETALALGGGGQDAAPAKRLCEGQLRGD